MRNQALCLPLVSHCAPDSTSHSDLLLSSTSVLQTHLHQASMGWWGRTRARACSWEFESQELAGWGTSNSWMGCVHWSACMQTVLTYYVDGELLEKTSVCSYNNYGISAEHICHDLNFISVWIWLTLTHIYHSWGGRVGCRIMMLPQWYAHGYYAGHRHCRMVGGMWFYITWPLHLADSWQLEQLQTLSHPCTYSPWHSPMSGLISPMRTPFLCQ